MLYMKEDDWELVNDIVSWSLDLLEHIWTQKPTEKSASRVLCCVQTSKTPAGRATGINSVGSLFYLQLAAAVGLINPVWSLYGDVTGNGTNGTFLYMQRYYPGGATPRDDIPGLKMTQKYFGRLYHAIKEVYPSFERMHLETTACALGRQGGRGNDIIFWDEVSDRLQNFYTVKRKSSTDADIRILYRGKWVSMSHVFEFFYQMGDTIDSEATMRIRKEEELPRNSWYQKYCRENNGNVYPQQHWDD